jgi:hypothetical protein
MMSPLSNRVLRFVKSSSEAHVRTCAYGVAVAEAASWTGLEAVLEDGALGAAYVGGVLSRHTVADGDIH